MWATIRNVLVPAGIGLFLLTLVGLAGATMVLYREASIVHPALGWAVVALAAAGGALLIVWPVAAVVRLPRPLVAPAETTGPRWERHVSRYAARLCRNRLLRDGWDGHAELVAFSRRRASAAELQPRVVQALEHLDGQARRRTARNAAAVFATTAVSQSGRLDALVVISGQMRTVREVAEVYYQRPTPRELLRLYANVGAAAFVAGELQDSELIAVLGAPVSAAATGLVPIQGTDPLVSLLVTSLLDGSANGFLTLRVGALARRYCGLRPDPERRAVAASASLEAAGMLATTISEGAARIATATRRLVVRGAMQSTSRVARTMTSVGTGALGKVAGLIDKTARKIGRQAKRPPQWVIQESLRFWDNVAANPRSGDDDSGERGEAAR